MALERAIVVPDSTVEVAAFCGLPGMRGFVQQSAHSSGTAVARVPPNA